MAWLNVSVSWLNCKCFFQTGYRRMLKRDQRAWFVLMILIRDQKQTRPTLPLKESRCRQTIRGWLPPGPGHCRPNWRSLSRPPSWMWPSPNRLQLLQDGESIERSQSQRVISPFHPPPSCYSPNSSLCFAHYCSFWRDLPKRRRHSFKLTIVAVYCSLWVGWCDTCLASPRRVVKLSVCVIRVSNSLTISVFVFQGN